MLQILRNTILLFILSIHCFAQSSKGTVKGQVIASDSTPAAFVPIGIKGTTLGTTTDAYGYYKFKAPEGNQILLIQLVGHEPEEKEIVIVAGETVTADFTLKENAKELQEVTVTGEKGFKEDHVSQSLRLTTPILELPQNIQIINKELLANQQTFDIMEGVARNVSGVQRLDQWETYAYINMRGTQVYSFRNGMNATMPWGPVAEDMSMVERIEFVKGPAGFMMTAGNPAGFYNVVTKKPTGVQQGAVGLTLGSFDTYRATVDLDGKLSKNGKLLYRLNVMGQMKNSPRDFEYNNRYSIVPVLKYQINNKSAITLEYTHQFLQTNVIGSSYVFSKRGYADIPVSFTTAEPNFAPTKILDRSLLGIFEHKFNRDWKLTAQLMYYQYNLTGQSMWPNTGFKAGSDEILIREMSLWDALGLNRNGQVFINGRFVTGSIEHNILGGVDLSYKDYFADWSQGAVLDTTFNVYAPKYGTISASAMPQWDRNQDIRTRGVRYNTGTNAVYLQDQLGFFDNTLKLTLAGRYASLKTINPYSGTSSDEKFTPRIGVNYLITKKLAVYALYDQAFLAAYGTDWQGNPFKPINAENMELGIKKDWFNSKWNSTLSVYQITQNNVLTADLEHRNVNGDYFSRQTGQNQSKGIEIDIKGEIVKNLDVVVNYAYNDSKVTKDSDPDYVGTRLSGANKHLHNTWLTYKITRTPLSGLRISAGYQFQGDRSNWTISKDSKYNLPNYFRLDGAIGYTFDNLSVNLLVNNLLNEFLYSGGYDTYYSFYYWQAEPRRNARLNVTYRF